MMLSDTTIHIQRRKIESSLKDYNQELNPSDNKH